jgi:hypothetical protein
MAPVVAYMCNVFYDIGHISKTFMQNTKEFDTPNAALCYAYIYAVDSAKFTFVHGP